MRNLQTGYISPQYHVVFDYLFNNVFSLGKNNVVVDSICNYLFEDNNDWYTEEEYEDDELLYIPSLLHKFWLDESESLQIKDNIIQKNCRNEERDCNHWNFCPEQYVISFNSSNDTPQLIITVSDDK